MNRGEARFNHLANGLVGATGVAYAWFRYFARAEDEFSQAGSTWQPLFQHLHVLAAPLLVFACGLIWRNHILSKYRAGARARRRTGLSLLACLLPMVASGYLIQVVVDERWHAIWMWAHLISSGIWIAAYGVHQFSKRPDPA